jgi:mono/diheme cytochrome c family protein
MPASPDPLQRGPSGELVIKPVVLTLLAVAVTAAAAGAVYVYSGVFNVAATDPHWPVSYWVMETTRVRSIRVHAKGIVPPAGFDDQAKVVSAVAHFSAHCAVCHGAPGADKGEFAGGMYPPPPDLTEVSKRYTPGELFWILKNGIKMSGMPSMADDGDEMLWSTVGLLEKLPSLSADDYSDLWMASQAQGGHDMSHMGGMNMNGMDMHGMHMGPETAEQPAGGEHASPAQAAPTR